MAAALPESPLPGPPPRRRSRAWVWFFLLLVALTLGAVVIEVWYNFSQQLTPVQLSAARALWKQNGPADYDLDYTLATIETSDHYVVQVRGGKVVAASRNGQPLEERLWRYQSMPALFDFVEDFLERDQQPGQPRTFVTARFDPVDGHLLHYVRSVMSRRERQEITVHMERPRNSR